MLASIAQNSAADGKLASRDTDPALARLVPFLFAMRPYAGNWRFTWHVVAKKPTAKVSPGDASPEKVSTAQLSDAVGSVQVTTALHWPASLDTVRSAGVPEIAGSSSSVTVTVKVEVVVLPWMSSAV